VSMTKYIYRLYLYIIKNRRTSKIVLEKTGHTKPL
jgi:hypothetical protein